MAKRICSDPDCDRVAAARGLCHRHWAIWRRQCDPREMIRPTIEQRFWRKVDASGGLDACWFWTASVDGGGYGEFVPVRNEKKAKAHRFAYELLVGPIPDGLELDHLCHTEDLTCHPIRQEPCRHRACCNPWHMEPVTHAENLRRGRSDPNRLGRVEAAKTHCKWGHPFDEANTYITPRGYRNCRACMRRSDERRRERRGSTTPEFTGE